MGLETAALVMAGVAVAGEVGKMSSQKQAARAQNDALDLQAKEMQAQYQEKSLSNLDVLQKVLDAQTAQMTVSGAAFSSPSFNAIQRATMNIGAKQQRNIDLEEDLAQANIYTEKQNVKSKLYAQLFGDLTNIASTGFSMYGKIPTTGA